MWKAVRRVRRLPSDSSGGVAILLALSIIPLSIALVGAVDLQRALSTKAQLQDALDAGVLAGAREPTQDLTRIRDAGAMAFRENLTGAPLTVTSGPAFALTNNSQVVTADAAAEVDTLLARLVLGGRNITVEAHAEARRAGANLEVALVLDITGSMNQPPGKILALKQAADDLIDIVVEDRQTPFFSKVALVPYSTAVNLGARADDVRGALKTGVSDKPGAERFRFRSMNGLTRTFSASPCVTERTGGKRYQDSSYKKDKVGRHYEGLRNRCPNEEVVPLTSSKAALKSRISRFTPEGSTAGQIGLAWGWYMVSPHFADLWTGEGRALPYKTKDLVKAVVLMTDGEFNTVYADGVVSRDALAGSGEAEDKIDRKADNGPPKTQALALCKNMKKAGVVIYTVGFDLDEPDAVEIMQTCATSADHAYLPSSGIELRQAFQAIGHDIARLHISR